jgi:hypothetical protein
MTTVESTGDTCSTLDYYPVNLEADFEIDSLLRVSQFIQVLWFLLLTFIR